MQLIHPIEEKFSADFRTAGTLPLKIAYNELVKLSVKHSECIGRLESGTLIRDHGVRLKKIASYLVAPGYLCHLAPDIIQLFRVRLLLQHKELDLQFLECFILILELGPLILAGNDNTGRERCDSDCRRGLIDMLSACAGGTIGIDSNILRIDLNVQVFLNIRHDFAGREGCLALSVGIERGNSD